MKKIVSLIYLLMSIIATNGQSFPLNDKNMVSYEGTFNCSFHNKNDLVSKAKEYFYEKCHARDLAIMNGEVDKILFYGSFLAKRNKAKPREDLNYIIKLFITDNQIKYQITNFVFYGTTSKYATTNFTGPYAVTSLHGGKSYEYHLERFAVPGEYYNGGGKTFVQDIDSVVKNIIESMRENLSK